MITNFYKIRENVNNNIYALDTKGKIFYRTQKNEFFIDGTTWKELPVDKMINNDLDLILDIFVDNKDLYFIDAKGVIVCFENINRPKLTDL